MKARIIIDFETFNGEPTAWMEWKDGLDLVAKGVMGDRTGQGFKWRAVSALVIRNSIGQSDASGQNQTPSPTD